MSGMKSLLGDTPYALPPHRHESDTSKAAAKSVKLVAGSRRERVFECIAASPMGRTNEEISDLLGWPIQSVCGRVRELAVDKHIKDSGRRRPTKSGRKATVWETA